MPAAPGVESRTYQFGSLKLEPNSKRVYAIGETLQAYIPTHLAGDQDVLSLQIVSQEEPLQVFASKTVPIAHYEGAPVVESQDLGALGVREPAYVRDKENVDLLLTLGDPHYRSRHYQRAAELFEATLVRRRPDTALPTALAVWHGQMGPRG